MENIMAFCDTPLFGYVAWFVITALIAAYVYCAPVAKNSTPVGLDEASDW